MKKLPLTDTERLQPLIKLTRKLISPALRHKRAFKLEGCGHDSPRDRWGRPIPSKKEKKEQGKKPTKEGALQSRNAKRGQAKSATKGKGRGRLALEGTGNPFEAQFQVPFESSLRTPNAKAFFQRTQGNIFRKV